MRRLLWLAAACLVAGAAAAEPLGEGDAFPEIALANQHGELRRVDAEVRVVLFSRDMDGGAVVRTALDRDPALLERHAAVYVSDVSRMPALVRGLIAKPRMRRRPYPVLLDEEGDATAALPSREGRPTVLLLEAGRIRRVAYPETPEALVALLTGVPIPQEASGEPD